MAPVHYSNTYMHTEAQLAILPGFRETKLFIILYAVVGLTEIVAAIDIGMCLLIFTKFLVSATILVRQVPATRFKNVTIISIIADALPNVVVAGTTQSSSAKEVTLAPTLVTLPTPSPPPTAGSGGLTAYTPVGGGRSRGGYTKCSDDKMAACNSRDTLDLVDVGWINWTHEHIHTHITWPHISHWIVLDQPTHRAEWCVQDALQCLATLFT